MKKAFRKIHLWLSVPFGVIITLICFSGAMLVFENEIMQMTHRHLYYVGKIGKKPIPMEQLAAKVSATLPDDVKVTGITVFPDPQKAYQINLSKPKRTSIYIYRRNQGQKPTLPVFQSHVFVTSLATG